MTKPNTTRIAISCPDDIYSILSDFSTLTNRPMSKVLLDFIESRKVELYDEMSEVKEQWLAQNMGEDFVELYRAQAEKTKQELMK